MEDAASTRALYLTHDAGDSVIRDWGVQHMRNPFDNSSGFRGAFSFRDDSRLSEKSDEASRKGGVAQ